MKIKFDTKGCECTLRDGFSEADTLYVNHCHPLYEIITVVCGKIAINIENKRYNVSAGEMVLIRPAEYHSITSLDRAEYRRFTLLFDASRIPAEIRSDVIAKISQSPVCRHEQMSSFLSRLESAMCRDDASTFAPLVEAMITELFYIAYEADTLVHDCQDDMVMQTVIEYIGTHLTEKITLEDVAAHALISKSALCHLFKSRMNISMKQYILQKKIAYAAELIKNGRSASAASQAVGYENYAGFYKMYKKFLLEPPMESKRQ